MESRCLIRQLRAFPTIAGIIPLLVFGLTACAPGEDPQHSGSGSGPESSDTDSDSKDGGIEAMDSSALLEGGMAGDFAVKCDFAHNQAVGTIYFYGSAKQRFDSVTAQGVPAHILMFEGQAHAWNDADAEGARYPKPDEVPWLVDEDPAVVKAHSTNCVPFDDLSIFELPEGVTFVDIADIVDG